MLCQEDQRRTPNIYHLSHPGSTPPRECPPLATIEPLIGGICPESHTASTQGRAYLNRHFRPHWHFRAPNRANGKSPAIFHLVDYGGRRSSQGRAHAVPGAAHPNSNPGSSRAHLAFSAPRVAGSESHTSESSSQKYHYSLPLLIFFLS
jgi:hypothetical protein